MGNTCCLKKKTKKKIVLLLLGLDNAGKSVAAKGLAGESLDSVVPTVGFSSVSLSYPDCTVYLYDLGGGVGIRGIWSRYFVDAHGIIFVVDSSDIDRLDEVKQVLRDLLSHNKIMGKPLLLLGNKQDQENALDKIDLLDTLEIEDLVNEKQCPTLVESCSATEINSTTKIDPGIKNGYSWLLSYIRRNYETLNVRVETDMRQQEIVEQQLRKEKLEKLRTLQESTKQSRKSDEDAIESYSEYNRKLNGEIKKDPSETDIRNNIFTLQTSLNNSSTDVSSKSTDSFPPIYYGNVQDEIVGERPKSAVQIVKEHLELDRPQRKLSIKSLTTNKTAPINLYGVKHPKSAGERRRQFTIQRRFLKSAGDSAFVPVELPNMVLRGPDGDDLHEQLFEMGGFEKRVKKMTPNGRKASENGTAWVHVPLEPDKTGISVIDI